MTLFEGLNHFKSLSVDSVCKDNAVFKLHYIATVTLLLAFSAVLSLSQYASDPIDCIKSIAGLDDGTFESYCWVEGTWTRLDSSGKDASSARCVDNASDPDRECWHHQYYQWMALVLVLQAACFYVPRFLWLIWEEGKVESLVSGLERGALVRVLQSENALDQGELKAKIAPLVQFFKETKGTHDAWAAKYYFCELLNAANVLLQFYATNWLLSGQFWRIARGGLRLRENDSVLPLVAECRLDMFGAGGKETAISGLCVLPLNLINQKFFTLFWFWLSFLLVVSVFMIIFRIFVMCSEAMRGFILRFIYRINDPSRSVAFRCSHGIGCF